MHLPLLASSGHFLVATLFKGVVLEISEPVDLASPILSHISTDKEKIGRNIITMALNRSGYLLDVYVPSLYHFGYCHGKIRLIW